MARFKLTIEYEGTRYSGWQIQKNARTVQGELAAALRTVVGAGAGDLQGAGRTDAGVHALGQVAHLDAETMLAPEILRRRVNEELPADINILEVEKTSPRFHARHDAVARSYLYQISRRRTALGKRYVWWVKDRLDAEVMRRTGEFFLGMKDFRSFTADDPEEKSTRVEIQGLETAEAGDLILIRVKGSHFLWKMVRQMVGVMAEAGRGKMGKEEIAAMLKTRSARPARLTAPPSGLFLERVTYRGDPQDHPLVPVIRI
ncbi:MAG: tRNA pseudouridine(38-40) synthase TruA [Bacteroidota bacterium]